MQLSLQPGIWKATSTQTIICNRIFPQTAPFPPLGGSVDPTGQAQVGITALEMCSSRQAEPCALCFWGKDGLLAVWETEARWSFPSLAGVGYQLDVILWHSSLRPASRGSGQKDAWEIQATAQRSRSANVRNRTLPRLLPGSPSPPSPFPHPQLHSETKQCKPTTSPAERKGKRAQLLFQFIALKGCLAAAAKGNRLSTQRDAARG